MKNYNKLPFKERKRHLEYQFNQTERQEEILLKREFERLRQEKIAANRSQEPTSEKEREMLELVKRVAEFENKKEGRDKNEVT